MEYKAVEMQVVAILILNIHVLVKQSINDKGCKYMCIIKIIVSKKCICFVYYIIIIILFMIKEHCIRHAQLCIRQARLVALQLKQLSPLVRVVHLTQDGADQFLASHPKFSEVCLKFLDFFIIIILS